MKLKFTLLTFLSMIGIISCHAKDVIATINNINVSGEEIFINLNIINARHEEVFMDKVYLASDAGALGLNVLEVLDITDGKEIAIPYRGVYRDYSEFHDFEKTKVSIPPKKSLNYMIDVGRHYSLSKSRTYKVRYRGVAESKSGDKIDVRTGYTQISM